MQAAEAPRDHGGHSPRDVAVIIPVAGGTSSRDFIEIVGIFKVGAREPGKRMLDVDADHLAPVLVSRHVQLALGERLGPLMDLAFSVIFVVVETGPSTKSSPPHNDFLRLGRRRALPAAPGLLISDVVRFRCSNFNP